MNLRGYRTILWNLVNAVIYAMELTSQQYGIPEAYEPLWLAVYIVGNVILRLDTRTPIGRKD